MEIKKTSKQQNLTIKEIVEESIRRYLPTLKKGPMTFKLQKSHFEGDGYVTKDFEGNWGHLRDISYNKNKSIFILS